MLENHSFDNLFAMSGISGIQQRATPSDYNTYNDQNYNVQTPAPVSMPTDPGHEFSDVVAQLAGPNATYPSGGPYPAITDAGFVSNYATSTDEKTGAPQPADVGDVMKCFDTPTQLPVIYQLATEFALCDQWYSALPGPTWPNRFFVHGASSAGLDDSPSTEEIAGWESVAGFKYPKGSVYDALHNQGSSYRFYIDKNGPLGGDIAQVAAIKGVYLWQINSLSTFASDLQNGYSSFYTFIEPNYGNVLNNTYEGGSCQHPMDSMYGGEVLIKSVYEAIRAAPFWETSLLVITYDEHGGFYDSARPGSVTAPNDGSSTQYNKHGFTFEQLGVRVPAVIVSPLIAAGTVDHTAYDHSSVLATLRQLLTQPNPNQSPALPLTDRDAQANNLLGLLTLSSARTDCPITLNAPTAVVQPIRVIRPAELQATMLQQPIPSKGNTQGFLQVLYKADLEMAQTPAEKQAATARYHSVHTLADAQTYAQHVQGQVTLKSASNAR